MEIRDLKYLMVSANEGSFTRAAKSLGINASTISRRVGRFEDELGLTVFERGHAGLRLTAGGIVVLAHIRRALGEFQEIVRVGSQSGAGMVGEVRLGVWMPPVGEPVHTLLAEWRKKHPNLLLTVSEMKEWEIQIALRERRIDVALVTSHTLWPDAASERLYRERLVAAIPRDHHLADQRTLDWDTLPTETFLVQGWDDILRSRQDPKILG